MAYNVKVREESYTSLKKVAEEKGVSLGAIYSFKYNTRVSAQAAALAYADGPRGEKGRSWTEDEISFLKANAGLKPRAELAEELGRTPGAVSKMANVLGLSLALTPSKRKGPINPNNGRKGWSEAEEKYLRDNYPELSITQLAKDLGKAKNTVRTHLKVMDLFIPQPKSQA